MKESLYVIVGVPFHGRWNEAVSIMVNGNMESNMGSVFTAPLEAGGQSLFCIFEFAEPL